MKKRVRNNCKRKTEEKKRLQVIRIEKGGKNKQYTGDSEVNEEKR